MSGRRTKIAYQAIILGVPRSGKSRLAVRLAGMLGLNHYALDSIVSALGEVFPQVGVGRQFEDSASAASLESFLLQWVRHLDYEGSDFVLEGYHIGVGTAATLANRGFSVAVLGIQSVDTVQKCREIREFAQEGDWSEKLSEFELFDLVVRYQKESARLKRECEGCGLTYFETGSGSEADLTVILNHFSLGA